jgi:uncharacterized protein YciI
VLRAADQVRREEHRGESGGDARCPAAPILRAVRYVLLYQTAEGAMEKAMEVLPRHQEHMQPFVADGRLLGIGTFGDPQAEGSMAIFTTREAAEAFVADDPFVLEGVVARHEIRAWDDALAG